MMNQENKYIYYIRDNRYRLKILKYSPLIKDYININEYINDTLDNVIKRRDEILTEYGISLEKNEIKDIFDSVVEKPKQTRKISSNRIYNSSDNSKVDKYIYELEKNKKYRVFIRKGGTNGQKGDYYSKVVNGTLTQARKIRDLKLAEFKLQKNNTTNKENIKFLEFVKIYFREYAEKELSPTTYQKDKRDVKNYLLPYIANTSLSKIDALTVQRIMSDLKDKEKQRVNCNIKDTKLSPTTINGVYRTLRKILNKAVDWDYLERNPVLKVKAPGVSKIEKQSYNREELLKILDLLSKEDPLSECLFTIAICTGLRRGELVGLHVEDIDFETNEIYIKRAVVYDEKKHKTIEKATKTKGSIRVVPVPIFCMDVIKDYLKIRSKIIHRLKSKNHKFVPVNNLFINMKGEILFPDTPSSKWIKFRKKHKDLKNVSLHGLRHSYCTIQMNENHSLAPADVQKLMGHSQLSTTYIYTHSNEDKRKETISIFDKYYSINKEIKLNFEQILSLYMNKNFITTSEKNKLLNELVIGEIDLNEKLNILKDEIDKKYFYFKDIDDSKLTIDNIADWLDSYKKRFGNEFVLQINHLG